MPVRLPRWFKIALVAVAGLVVVAVAGIVVLASTIDLAKYARLAAGEVKAATGRELRIGGKLDLEVFPRLALVAEDVSFANAPWGSRPAMARVKRLEASVALLPLLRKEVEITRLALVEPDVLLETDAKGVGNWVFKPAAGAKPGAESDSGGLEVELRHAAIDRGVLTWRNGAKTAPTRLAIQRLRLDRKTLGDGLNVDLTAAFREQPFTLKGSMGSLRRLFAKDPGWPVDLVFATAGATASLRGAIDLRAQVPLFAGNLAAEVKDAAGLAQLAGGPLALPVPFTLAAKGHASRDEYVVEPLQATLGKGRIDGRIVAKTGGPRPFVTATLNAPLVDLAAGGAPRGGARAGAAGRSNGRVFSDAPIPLALLRGFDGAADASIERLVLANGVPLEKVRVKATLKDGRLDAQPLQALVGGGSVTGRAALDARPTAPTLALTVQGKGISGEKVAAAMGHGGTVSGGSIDLALDLAGPGDSVARFMGGAHGEIRATMGPARTSGAALEFGGDVLSKVADLANPGRRTDKHNEIKCAVVRLPVRAGIATASRTIAIETARVNMVAAGTINFRTEALDLALRPTVNEGLGIGAASLAELVRVTGTLANPRVGIDTLGSARAALSVGGAILTGGLSLLGEAALKKSAADPHPCQTALAGGVAPKPATEQATPQEESGVLGPIRRLFK